MAMQRKKARKWMTPLEIEATVGEMNHRLKGLPLALPSHPQT